jgi:N-acetylated-alpha-linked acidic dipeptidase
LTDAAARYKKVSEAARPTLATRPEVVKSVNARLIQSERQLLDPAGLKNRTWFRHLIYAPGFYTGYAVKTLPGVREGIEQKWYADVEPEVARAAKAIDRLTALVDAAARELEAR